MHAKHQDRHHDGADNDAAMHGFAVFVGDTAHCGMWQTNNAEADQHPKRGHKGWREDIFRALRGHQLDVDRLQRLYRMANPPAAWITPTSSTIVPISITMPCIVSLSTLARKPP